MTTNPKFTTAAQGAEAKLVTGRTVVDLFREIASARPGSVALRHGSQSLSYAELDRKSDLFARSLQGKGIARGEFVGILLERSLDLYVAMLAIAKIGAAFVPIENAICSDLVNATLRDSGIRYVVTAVERCGAQPAGIESIPVASLAATGGAEFAPCTVDPNDPFYVMFTSGSTGTPKGVVVPHRAVVRLVRNQDFANFGPDEVVGQFSPVHFDASTFEIWGSLLNGGCLAVPPPHVLSLDEIAATIREQQVTTIWMTAALFHLAVDRKIELFAPLKQLLFGGDVVSPERVARMRSLYPSLRMVNGYGPTENTTFTTCYEVPGDFVANGGTLPIGMPINGTDVHILDDNFLPVAKGERGQLCASGAGLALGYLRQQALTDEKFVRNPLDGELMYLTGDVVRELPDGNIEFFGRVDGQVKISGHRVELSAIEMMLRNEPRVREAVALAQSAPNAEKQIVAFVELKPGFSANEAELRTALNAKLPPYAVPTRISICANLPIGVTGKIDRQALQQQLAPKQPAIQSQSADKLERRITALWKRTLGREDVDIETPFFEQGGTSLQIIEIHHELQSWGYVDLSIVELFQHATIQALTQRLTKSQASVGANGDGQPLSSTSGMIAIVGMAGRFPGANNPAELWKNFIDGREAIRKFDDAELEDSFDEATRNSGQYVKARAILDDVESFDAEFFGMLPKEAELTDPQQRLLLECAWEALEDAGYAPKAYSGRIGVFAGASINTYLLRHICADRKFVDEFTSVYQVGAFPMLVGNGADFTASRVSYKLDLRGPAMTVQSACSTSMLAVAQACEGLRTGKMDMALAGAASVSLPQRRGYLYQQGGMVSADGHCRPFDAKANGTVFGSGAGMVLLKRYDDAVRDGDHIYAVIRGVGINNDGAAKAGYAAPSVDGQAAAIAMAHRDAGVEANTIDYVECHGTGTPLGDPIEVAALAMAFNSSPANGSRCALSSAKSAVGHLDVAAGVTGLIRAAMALHHEVIPGTLHYSEPNPRMEIEKTPFYVTADNLAWPKNGHPRRAGVSAFGVGGTNVHLVLEEASKPEKATSDTGYHVLPISARSPEALQSYRVRLQKYFECHPEANIADAAYTLSSGRQPFAWRSSVVGRTAAEIASALANGKDAVQAQKSPEVVFLFPGQGAQYPGMAAGLYAAEPEFRAAFNECFEVGSEYMPAGLKQLLCSRTSEVADRLRSTENAQPALFIVEYALARLWMSWGVQPFAMIGHSVGEITAACLAGVFSLSDALKLVAKRGQMMQRMQPGAMLSVRMAAADLVPYLQRHNLSMAAVNSPLLCVASGPTEQIAALEAELEPLNIPIRRLHTSHAFHSATVDPILPELIELLGSISLGAPQLKIISSCTGETLTADRAKDRNYWARHCRETVQFAKALGSVEGKSVIFIEAGPGQTLETLARQQIAKDRACIFGGSLPGPDAAQATNELILRSLGLVWGAGCDVQWKNVFRGEQHHRVSLPTYAFQRKRYWIEAPKASTQVSVAIPTNFSPQLAVENGANRTGMDKPTDMPTTTVQDKDRKGAIAAAVRALLEELSGVTIDASQDAASFVELGFDSLFLTQVTQEVQKHYSVKVTFRQLLGEYSSVQALTDFLDEQLPPDAFSTPAPTVAASREEAVMAPVQTQISSMPMPAATANSTGIEGLLRDQLQAMSALMQRQLEVLQGVKITSEAPVQGSAAAPAPTPVAATKPAAAAQTSAVASVASALLNVPKAGSSDLTEAQHRHIDRLIDVYTRRTAKSKQLTQQYRGVLADPRVVAGFRPEWKEMVYSIVTDRSKGSKLWDVDGNEYIDLVNGFGPTMFGHAPDFVTEAIAEQMKHGFEIGPQTPLAGKVAQLISEMTGCERVTFCNTGSEAVMAAIRVSRTVTGRSKIVFFAGDYHGQFDEVLVKPIRRNGVPHATPAAPGIPAENLGNIVVLDYGSNEALEYIRQHANELAAVMVEPVQSRHPNLQPKEFLQEVRRITAESGTAFIFDEVVNGFRVHPGGAQAVFGIHADLVTYGKVVGGGMPIGILAGSSTFMDALDGGKWQFGDASAPEVGMTFLAGTFVRHPLTLAATYAVLSRMKEQGPALQASLNEKADKLVHRLNGVLDKFGLTARVENFGSIFYFNLHRDTRFASLLYHHLRAKGIHILEGFPCYLTTEHSQADLDHIVSAFDESLAAMLADGLIDTRPREATPAVSQSRAMTSPLTEAQLEVMLAAQLGDAASCAFNESFSLHLNGELDVATFRAALNAVIARHDSLRAVLAASGDSFLYRESLELETPLVDLSSMEKNVQGAEISKIIEREAVTPFDLHNGPLVRTQLVRLANDSHQLIWTAHHVVCDGWSINVLLDELGRIYSSRRKGSELKLDPVLSFAEFAERLNAQKDSADQQKTEQYWAKQFETVPTLLDLPTDMPRPAQRSYVGNTCYATLPESLNTAIRQFSAKRGCTKFVTLLAAFQLVLARLAQQQETVVLVPSAAQSQVEDAVLVGHGVNLLPIRMRVDAETTTAAYLAKLNSQVLDAYEHAGYTFGSLVRKLNIKREPGRLPLSEIQFNLERVGDGLHLEGLKASVHSNGKRFTNFDLFLNVVDTGSELRLECDYNSETLEESTVLRWMGHYRTMLESMLQSADSPASRLALLNENEIQHILFGMNNTAAQYPREATLPMLIAEQAARTPSKIAVTDAAEQLTYAELERRSGQVANLLVEMGTRPGDMVGVLVDRAVGMVVTLLGVLKAGGTYVPLDPIYPKARIEFILNETQVPVLITLQHHLQQMPVPVGTQVVCLDRDAAKIAGTEPLKNLANDAGSLAYVIYTSGSTGQPKGVEISHRALVNLLVSAKNTLGMTDAERLLAVTTISFDIAGLELFMPLISGATVMVASKADVADGKRLSQLIADAGITIMQGTPATWKLLLEAEFAPMSGFKVLCGGEAWSRDLADRLLALGCRIWNMYGPTETTIWSSITPVEKGTRPPYIKSSVANTTFYVLDNAMQPLAFGVPGQLFIGGDSVARGYFRRPELTASRFVRDAFAPGNQRMYATGDRVRLHPDGSIEFLGRADFQVKIRGYRIELGEVESAFTRVTGVSEAVAVAHNFGNEDHRLVLYYVSSSVLENATIRNGMRELVPDYMVPAMFVRLESFPLTDNGKIDRKSLPSPTREEAGSGEAKKKPQSQMEEIFASVCAQVLGIAAVGIDEDLMDLGADSIHLFQITARATQQGLPISAKLLWSHRTVEKICAAIGNTSTTSAPKKESAIRPRSRDRYRVSVGD